MRGCLTRALTVALAVGLGLVVAEVALRRLAPIPRLTVGSASNPNAAVFGWGFAPGEAIVQRHPDSGKPFAARANALGFKDVEHAARKPPGRVRILVLGDSSTFGLVPLQQVYTRVLERLLREAGYDAEVIALGYGGWGTDQALVALEQVGLPLQPDVVISQFDTTDLTDNLGLEGLAARKPFRYRLDDDGELRRVERDPRGGPWRRLVSRSHLLAHLQRLAGRAAPGSAPGWRDLPVDPTDPMFVHHAGEEDPAPLEAAWRLYEALVSRMAELSRRHGALFVLFNEVERGHLEWEIAQHRISRDENGELWVDWRDRRYPVRYMRHAERLEALADRLDTVLVPNRRPYPRFRTDPHANEAGNRRMAEDLFDFLTSHPPARALLEASRDGDPPAE